MKTIKATTLASYLKNDPLYGHQKYAGKIIQEFAESKSMHITFSRGVNFQDDYYGIHRRARDEGKSVPLSFNFFIGSREVYDRMRMYKGKYATGGKILGPFRTKRAFLELNSIVHEVKIENVKHFELATLFFCSGLKIVHNDSIISNNVEEFENFVTAEYGGILIDAFEHIRVKDDHLQEFLTLNALPLLSVLNRDSIYNTTYFLDNCNFTVWDDFYTIDSFREFYKRLPNKILPFDVIDNGSNKIVPAICDKSNSPVVHQDNANYTYEFYREGDAWRFRFGGDAKSIYKSEGMYYLHVLVSNPDKYYYAEDLYILLHPEKKIAVMMSEGGVEGMYNNYFRGSERESKDDIDIDVEKEKDAALEDLNERFQFGVVSQEDYEEQLAKIENWTKICKSSGYLEMNKALRSTKKTVKDRIIGALGKISEFDPGLYQHLAHIVLNVDLSKKLKRKSSTSKKENLSIEEADSSDNSSDESLENISKRPLPPAFQYCYRPDTKIPWRLV